ncbi:transposase [Lentilactobacillus parakefiri]|uniref:transposase n=1 Tax=Lentilactobacillus parakefiri TaxID=152332 RepID=UPI001CDAB452|nr:transposase [Lentilactobacillus parakefiri]
MQFPQTKQQLWDSQLWSPGYFMSTVGNFSKEVIARYINSKLDSNNGVRPRY